MKNRAIVSICAMVFVLAQVNGGCRNMTSYTEHTGLVTMGGKPLVLVGNRVRAGDSAPDFKAVDAGFKTVTLADFKGKVVLISAVPSLDTKVCSLQTKRFNEESAKLPGDVVIVTISADLTFAQKRFCATEGIDRIKVLSDSVWHDFGLKYGLVIKDMGLLARSVFVVGKDGKIAYEQIVPELSNHPDYDAALKAARDACSR
jgi:thioredoxin-dependent peroxiredoxin